jgi:hypothetical protein
MKMKTSWVIVSAIIFGILFGVIQFLTRGGVLKSTLGIQFTFFFLPLILPFIIAVVIFSLDNESIMKKRVLNGVLFWIIGYLSYWIPFILFKFLGILLIVSGLFKGV